MHRFWIAPAITAAMLAGCQTPSPSAGTFALGEGKQGVQRVLAGTSVPYSTRVSTVAGTGRPGFMEGPAASAQFNTPQGITVDASGNLYVADTFNMGVRMITPTGMVMTVGFPFVLGKLFLPTSVAATPAGLAVLEMAKNRIQFLAPNGDVTPFVGGAAVSTRRGFLPGTYGFADGIGQGARFQSMGDMCVTPAGLIYITDRNRVRLAYPDGTVKTIAGVEQVGHVNGPGSQARFNTLKGIAVAPNGHLYVVDAGNHRIRRLVPNPLDPTQVMVDTIAGYQAGYQDAVGAGALFNDPTDIAVDASGSLYVTDSGNHRIRKILSDNSVITLAGDSESGLVDGTGDAARFNRPSHVAVDAAGTLYVTDLQNHAVRRIEQL